MNNLQLNPILADALPAMSQKDLGINQMLVYRTNDLQQFKILEGNRPVNLAHVKRLVDSIKSNGYLINPIIVNKYNEIIDGQHRIYAAKECKSHVWVLINPDAKLKDAVIFNANSSDWSLKDYLKSYCDLGYDNYIKLKNFYNLNNDFGLSNCIELTSLPFCGRNKVFQQGLYKFKDDNKAEYIFNGMRKIINLIPEAKTAAYLRAIEICLRNNQFDLNYFIKKVTNYPSEYRKNSHQSVIISNIEHIYNFRNQGHTRIILQSK
jgi:hypothetical protein